MNLQTLIAARNLLELDVKNASKIMKKYPKGEMGITATEIKNSPEYKADKVSYDKAFKTLRDFNGKYSKIINKK